MSVELCDSIPEVRCLLVELLEVIKQGTELTDFVNDVCQLVKVIEVIQGKLHGVGISKFPRSV